MVDATHAALGTFRGLARLAEATLAAERWRQSAERLAGPVRLAVADCARANTAAGAGSYRRAQNLTVRATDELGHYLVEDGALAVLGMLHLSSAHALLRSHPDDAFAHVAQAQQLAARTGETRQWWM